MIYTRLGDDGTTSLADGTRLTKDDPRIAAYGTLDELNSFIGLLQSKTPQLDLQPIQRHLFVAGGTLARAPQVLDQTAVDELEQHIDALSDQLPPLHNFILPTGNEQTCLAHVCRTICRRAERQIIALKDKDTMVVLRYMNRLSDFFFIVARFLAVTNNTAEVTL